MRIDKINLALDGLAQTLPIEVDHHVDRVILRHLTKVTIIVPMVREGGWLVRIGVTYWYNPLDRNWSKENETAPHGKMFKTPSSIPTKRSHSPQTGFTLIELMITHSILAILLATAIPAMTEFLEHNRSNAVISDMNKWREAMTITSMSLGEHWELFIKNEIRSGRYGSASEVVRDALRTLEERKVKLNALRSHLAEGTAQTTDGNFITQSTDEILEEFKEERHDNESVDRNK